jgi:hypothetical protein
MLRRVHLFELTLTGCLQDGGRGGEHVLALGDVGV